MHRESMKTENIFLVLATIFVGIMIVVMPLNRVPDEITHADIAWKITHESNENSYNWRASLGNEASINKSEYKDLFTDKLDLNKERLKLNFDLKKIQYIPQAVGMLIGSLIYSSIGVIMTFGRFLNAIFYIVSLFFLIKYMKFGKNALVFISLLPISIQQAASLSYDVANFVSISFFFAVLSNLISNKRLDVKKSVLLLLSMISLYLTKPNNLAVILILPFIGLLFPEKFNRLNGFLTKFYSFCKKWRYLLCILGLVIAVVLATLYFQSRGGITHFAQIMLNTIFNNNMNAHLNSTLAVGMFGFIGWFQMQLPLWLIYIDIAVLTILIINGASNNEALTGGNAYVRNISALILPLQIIIIIGGMYFAWTPRILGENATISVGAQGRYFTPFLIFLTPLLMNLSGGKSKSNMSRLLIYTLIFNFLITIYLISILYWFPGHQGDWLLRIREIFN